MAALLVLSLAWGALWGALWLEERHHINQPTGRHRRLRRAHL